MKVALGASTATLGTEGLLVCKAKEEESEVVQQHVVGVVIEARAFLQVRVVTGQTAVEVAFGDLWTPDREQAIALGVGVVQHRTLPLIATPSRSERHGTG